MRCALCNHLLHDWEDPEVCDECLDAIEDTIDSYDQEEEDLWDLLMEEDDEDFSEDDVDFP